MTPVAPFPPDQLNAVGVLTRREIEARLLVPLLDALGDEFGRERVLEITRQTILQIARQQGAQLAETLGGNDLERFSASLELWKKDDALQFDLLEQTNEKFSFNVRRCRYAEMYRQLGVPELGVMLSCNRDFALSQGFNPCIHLARTQTIIEGADYCDFRFELSSP